MWLMKFAYISPISSASHPIPSHPIRTYHGPAISRYLLQSLVGLCPAHGGMINRWPHQKTSTLDDVIARNGT